MDHFTCLFANSLFEKSDKSESPGPDQNLCDENMSMFAPNHMRTRRQRRHMSTPPHPRGSHGPVQFPGELPRPRVRLGYDFHGLRARECIGKMCPFRARPPPMFAIVRSGACAQCSRRAAPHVCGECKAHAIAT